MRRFTVCASAIARIRATLSRQRLRKILIVNQDDPARFTGHPWLRRHSIRSFPFHLGLRRYYRWLPLGRSETVIAYCGRKVTNKRLLCLTNEKKITRNEERRILTSLFMISQAARAAEALYRHDLLSLLLWQRLNLTSSSSIIRSLFLCLRIL